MDTLKQVKFIRIILSVYSEEAIQCNAERKTYKIEMVFLFKPSRKLILGILSTGHFVILVTDENRIAVASISGKIELLSIKLKGKEDCMVTFFFTPSLFM